MKMFIVLKIMSTNKEKKFFKFKNSTNMRIDDYYRVIV